MAYVPGFINDIFISYSHLDDQAVVGAGWVTDLHQHLVIEVEEELGEQVRVWRDKRLAGTTDFTTDLEKQVRGSAILLAVLSPGYLHSKWCDWELTGFAGSRRIGDLWVDTKCRAIKVFKRPADVSRLRVLAETEGVQFFDVDPETGRSYESFSSSDLYKRRLRDLGHEIGFILRAMRKARSVFLGTASPPLHEQRERVRQELVGRDYRVLTAPDGPPDDRRMSVRAAVNESALSVLFYDRTAPVEQSAEALAALEREVALDQRAKQIVVVHGLSDIAPWDEPGARGRGSANVEWLIDPQTDVLCQTVLQMLVALPAPVATSGADPLTAKKVAHQSASHTLGSLEPSKRPVDPLPPDAEAATHDLPSDPRSGGRRSIFICYRREDTQDATGRLHDRLLETYGAESVFIDIDNVPLGVDFIENVAEQISRCSAVIVMIGRQWLKIKDKGRRRRLDHEDDLVRVEVAAALRRQVPVIPVLVQDAEMPRGDELPENIRPLARRNGIALSATRWRTDVERLIKELDRVMKA